MNLKTKFYHVTAPKPRRCTLAISVPSKQDLIDLLHIYYLKCENTGFEATLGISLVHPKDRYNHKLGRKKALEKQQEVYYYLLDVARGPGGTIFRFSVTNKEKNALIVKHINFLIQPDKNVVHVQFVDVTNIKRI